MARGTVRVLRLDWLPGVWQVEQRGLYPVNCWFVSDRTGCYLIDAGMPRGARQLVDLIRWLLGGRRLDGILLTHGHPNHVGAAFAAAAALAAPLYAHPEEVPYILGWRRYREVPGAPRSYRMAVAWRRPLAPDPRFPILPVVEGEAVGPFTVLHTPGHSPGHVTYVHPVLGAAFCGDLFLRLLPWVTGPPWPFTPHPAVLRQHQRRVLSYGAVHWLLPGHGSPVRLGPKPGWRRRGLSRSPLTGAW
ncbi:MAG: MBL fold metallo-hydrolase [Firmicutes bacterium]|nr:MBL fold metallo-hydrolase [Bacillota bacterium]